MEIQFFEALSAELNSCIAFAGAGGKTTAVFQLARQMNKPVVVTTTTHLGTDQSILADIHIIVSKPDDINEIRSHPPGVVLVTGPENENRLQALDETTLAKLHELCVEHRWPLLIEADGSQKKPLKAPASHEPPIPDFVDTVVVVAGLSVLGQPLSKEIVHRSNLFSKLGKIKLGNPVTEESIYLNLSSRHGGLKNIPSGAQRFLLLNQLDTPSLEDKGSFLAAKLLPVYDTVILASLKKAHIYQVHTHIACIILAAGGSTRFGKPKQLLIWQGKPFVRAAAETALAAGLSQVVVVTGAHGKEVEAALHGLPVVLVVNPHWHEGQSSSIQVGLTALLDGEKIAQHRKIGAVIFTLADQPQVKPDVIQALCRQHATSLASIITPEVNGKRANPVLFDKRTFAELMKIRGDTGGRALFSILPVTTLPWNDASLLLDVDKNSDLLAG
jgi:molybdenum cofactor cytidylyltransferase